MLEILKAGSKELLLMCSILDVFIFISHLSVFRECTMIPLRLVFRGRVSKVMFKYIVLHCSLLVIYNNRHMHVGELIQ